MYIIAGLGNPGDRYAATRHNAGFEAAARLRDKICTGGVRIRFHAEIASGLVGTEKVLVIRPLTYMNESGIALREITDFYKVPADHVIVMCDDIDLPFGHLRIRGKGSAGSHNGLKSIVNHIGTDFIRVRIGVGAQPEGWDLADYVLSQMSREQIAELASAEEKAADAAVCVIEKGLQEAMNRFITPKPKKKREETDRKQDNPDIKQNEPDREQDGQDRKQEETV
jgi:PTH1 family peptidyl-tRNA hydrolase